MQAVENVVATQALQPVGFLLAEGYRPQAERVPYGSSALIQPAERAAFILGDHGTAEEVVEKGSYFVIPNEVRNLSGFYSQQNERFLGAPRASE
jgi:hypothetical protein